MPRAAAHLLDAVLRTQKPEDRVTEVLAVALREHECFRVLVLAKARLVPLADAEGLTAEVRTQRRTDAGRLVDLELVVWQGPRPVARLWCENKLWAGYQQNQLPHYSRALKALAGTEPRCLVTIVPAERAAEIESRVEELAVEVPVWTWADVGACAEKAGRRADPEAEVGRALGSWRHRPGRADQRVLVEFLWLLNRQEGVMTTELRADHAVALATYGDAEKIALELCEQGIARSASFEPSPGKRGGQRRGTWEYYVLEPSPERGSWRELGSWPELYRDQFDKFVYERTGAATIFVGMSVPGEHAEFLTGEECAGWRETIESRGFAVTALHDDPHVRVFAPLYLLELAAKYSSFDAQVERVGRHVDDSLDFLLNQAQPPAPSGIG